MTNSLSQTLAEARRAIGRDGELPYGWRRRLWQVFVDELGNEAGARAWAAVQAACARHAWPVWRGTFPDEDLPLTTLEAAEVAAASLTAPAPVATFGQQLASLKAFLDEKFTLGPSYFSAIYAGFASYAGAIAVLYRREAPDAGELAIDPTDWDASFFASLAYGGGAVWEEGVGDPQARRRYWEWFLDGPVATLGRAHKWRD